MTCFFHLIGRLGNLLFIYAHARAYCEQNGYELCLPPWVGEQIFDIPHANRTRANQCDRVMPEDTHQRQSSLIYTRKQVREWLRIKPDVLERLKPVTENRKPVLLDRRQAGDMLGAGMVHLNETCYLEAAQERGYAPDNCEWEVDNPGTRLPAFQGDVSASGLNTTWVSLPAFYRMMTATIHFRANSSFSWWAATLGNARVFAPVIRGMTGGVPNQHCHHWAEGNWPVCADNPPNTDLHL